MARSMTRNINWSRENHPPILTFGASKPIILEWRAFVASELIILERFRGTRPPPEALIPAIKPIPGAVIRVTAVYFSTGAAGAARRGTDHRRVRCANYGICGSMRNSAAERLDAVPSAEGGMTRLAFACAQEKGADVDTLLRKAGLSRTQIEDPHVRISVRSQVVFLDLVANPCRRPSRISLGPKF